MTRPISKDLRERIVELKESGASYQEVADQLLVGRATVNRVLRRKRETGDVEPRPHGGGKPLLFRPEEMPRVKAIVDEYPDATLPELAVLVGEELGRRMSRATMGRTMVRLRLLEEEGVNAGHSGPRAAFRGSGGRNAPMILSFK